MKTIITFTMALLVSLSSLAQPELKIEQTTNPAKVKISGSPSSKACYEYKKPYKVVNGEFKNRIKHEGAAFLGVTAVVNGEKTHFPAKVVENSNMFGEFSKTYDVPIGNMIAKGGRIKWIASFWRMKVHKRNCKEFSPGGEGNICKWCKDNGYHLQSRIVKETYEASFNK